MDTPTIAAIATPPGRGGVGIIKISGSNAVNIATRTFRHNQNSAKNTNCRTKKKHVTFQSHRLYYGHIIDPDTCDVLDEVLLSVMKAPRSYTREDVVEIQAHSGPAVMRNILSLVVREGARIAEPGEFTRRAFLNGRIDLTQAEAIIDLINARTDAAFKAATNQISGRLREVVESVYSHLSELLARIEAVIDFPEEMDDLIIDEKIETALRKKVTEPILNLIRNFKEAHIYRDGFDLAIVGRPNVGKSSLLNRLVEKDRVIVDAVPGTTRDIIDCAFQIHGIPVNIIDTAGIHATEDPVEKIGISKTQACIDDADLVMLVLDASEPLRETDHKIYEYCQIKSLIYVNNKIDLVKDTIDESRFIPEDWKAAAHIPVSALFGTGIDLLKKQIFSEIVDNPLQITSHSIIPNMRHHDALEKCGQNVKNITNGLRDHLPLELVAIDIHEAQEQLEAILGAHVGEDLLDRIFNQFCIGK